VTTLLHHTGDRGESKIGGNGKMNGTTREERIKGAVEKYLTNQAKQGKRGRKWKAVKLFSIDRYEPQRERAIMGASGMVGKHKGNDEI
jgi:hypothetical protein